MKKSIKTVLIIIAISLICLFLIRLINPKEIDDVSPRINCPEIQEYNPSTLYVIPYYDNKPISNNTEWCNYILSLNKTLKLHGITHTYKEFLLSNISQEELNYGISEFEKCFNKTPEMFKPPQLKISTKNKQLVKNNNLILKNKLSQTTHKVYHCNNSGKIDNKIINIF
jgi:predicted deacetylase